MARYSPDWLEMEVSTDVFQVTVVTPVYNAAPYVARAVESAVDLEEVGEILLIDDSGPDTSLVVCRDLEREFAKVRLLRHPDLGNHGAGASRNLGIENASFDYIAFLDADDFYLPNRFTRDREILLANPTIDGVYGAIGVHYESDEARQRFLAAGYGYQEFLTVTDTVPPEELAEVLFHCHPTVTGEFSTIAITVRKSLFERSGLFSEHLHLQQDTHLWRRMAAVGQLAGGYIDKAVAVRGVHLENRMTNQEEQARYMDVWWEDLRSWFDSTQHATVQARRAFSRAYCEYRVTNRSSWEGRRAFLAYILRNPKLIFQPMGFFDLNLFAAFGRNWFTLHFTSAKNRFLPAAD